MGFCEAGVIAVVLELIWVTGWVGGTGTVDVVERGVGVIIPWSSSVVVSEMLVVIGTVDVAVEYSTVVTSSVVLTYIMPVVLLSSDVAVCSVVPGIAVVGVVVVVVLSEVLATGPGLVSSRTVVLVSTPAVVEAS